MMVKRGPFFSSRMRLAGGFASRSISRRQQKLVSGTIFAREGPSAQNPVPTFQSPRYNNSYRLSCIRCPPGVFAGTLYPHFGQERTDD